MKRLLLVAICLVTFCAANAQQTKLALDEHNKYIYYEVVDMAGISADSLHKNARGFIEHAYPKGKPESPANYHALIKDKFLTYTPLVKHESGEITYNLNIECKDGKYRYWLTDFVFTPYERNRYGMYVPVNGVNVPLETGSPKMTKKELDGYLDQTNVFCKQLSDRLKKFMVEGRPQAREDKPVKKIVTDKW